MNYFQRNNSENTEKYRKYLLKSVIIYKNENALKEDVTNMMMNVPLTISSMMERAEKLFPKKEIVSRTHDTITTLTYSTRRKDEKTL